MDASNQKLFNILRFVGPLLFFVAVFFVCFKLAGFGLEKSAMIAGVTALIDYYVLTWVMKRSVK